MLHIFFEHLVRQDTKNKLGYKTSVILVSSIQTRISLVILHKKEDCLQFYGVLLPLLLIRTSRFSQLAEGIDLK